jgi:hypothetical protein
MAFLQQQQARDQEEDGEDVPVPHAQQSGELKEESYGEDEREVEPRRGVGQPEIQKNRRSRQHGVPPPVASNCFVVVELLIIASWFGASLKKGMPNAVGQACASLRLVLTGHVGISGPLFTML